MGYTLTGHYDKVIDQLIRAGYFGNRSEVVRAGLRKLEEEYLGGDYLRRPSLSGGTLARANRRQTKAGRKSEQRPGRASSNGTKRRKEPFPPGSLNKHVTEWNREFGAMAAAMPVPVPPGE